MIQIVSVKFRTAGKHYDFLCDDLSLSIHDQVIVETDRGLSLGTVTTEPRECEPQRAPEKLKNVLRLATADDIAMAAESESKEKEAFDFCLKRIQVRRMEMKLVRAEYLFDSSKIIFYFTADGRVDFRDLVKDLAQQFRTRIEMRQIGVRDEAKITGGIGICGRALCCCSFLINFAPVSVKMAKEQNLALNPSKISGQCGRLLCCLNYEYETYREYRRELPKCGRRVRVGGHEGTVVAQNVLARRVTIRREDNTSVEVPVDQLEVLEKLTEKPSASTKSIAPRPRNRQTGRQTDRGYKQTDQQAPAAHDTEERTSDHPSGQKADLKESLPAARKKSRRRPRRRPANSKPSGDKNG